MTIDESLAVRVSRTTATEAPSIGRISAANHFEGLPAHDLNRLPAVRSEAGWLGPYWLQAASLAGRSHRRTDGATSGQDVYGYALDASGSPVTVLAVADGLGSRSHSHVGATLAVRFACDELVKLAAQWSEGADGATFGTDAELADLMRRVNARLLSSVGQGARSVSTTLLVCALISRGDQVDVVALRIGDPTAYVLTRTGGLVPLWPEAESGALNVVDGSLPWTGDEMRPQVARSTLDQDVQGVVLLSDGVGNDVVGSPEIEAWLVSRWSSRLDAFAMADSLRYDRQGSSDDRTALVALVDRRPAPGRVGPPASARVRSVNSPAAPSTATSPRQNHHLSAAEAPAPTPLGRPDEGADLPEPPAGWVARLSAAAPSPSVVLFLALLVVLAAAAGRLTGG